ncbi:LLM class flavin-dependent oxidoreductase [Streptomyces tsukubensis]|uniref:LLM class F420-dependent oxidoreductase n=1 Tax=Streptomyces tsukubensis TaxID=83656 RepID=A0A1V4AGL9_9ACTN|nr:LLM class flavin-dependent oxidoreductase [Streptomyces tsukubensis]OON82583.1 LLM class F420-dependent oxidoreductase [Streptomyces tsukubensis]QFR92253.1 LLM class flavin-dependent oxidoreductase [Streptomyces tsukubensis]
MRLAAHLVHEKAGDLASAAEDAGFDLVICGEGYRSDAPSVLGVVAGRTRTIGLASGVMQIPARSPGLAALTASTLHALSGGRFRMGLGVSNPDVSEGWYGVPFDQPLARTREYVEIVRAALAGAPVRYEGEHYRLPIGSRDGAPLHIHKEPGDTGIPIYLAALSSGNLRLAGEIANGWIGAFVSPESLVDARAGIQKGRDRAGKDMRDFDVAPSVPTLFVDNVAEGIDRLRGHYAHFLGMGDPERNVYSAIARRIGFGKAMTEFHRTAAEGDLTRASKAIPDELVDRVSLIGPVDRVAGRMREFRSAGASTLTVMLSPARVDHSGRLELISKAAEAFALSESKTG